MQVILQVSSDAARILHKRERPSTDAQELLAAAEELGVVLKPMHPGTQDDRLLTFFMANVPDQIPVRQAIVRLRQCKATKAAYTKPPDEPP